MNGGVGYFCITNEYLNNMHERAVRIIKKHITHLQVDLTNEVVLTETGSNYYVYMPIIAALCGAKKVYALAKDSSYGKASDHIAVCSQLANQLQLSQIEFFENQLSDEVFVDTTIVTNSGALRPLTADFLAQFKQSIVLPLMFEAWEIRPADLDIHYCQKHHIKVAGTSEHHPDVAVFRYSGLLAMKLAFEAGFEVCGNTIIVISNDDFGKTIHAYFTEQGAVVHWVPAPEEAIPYLSEADFVFIAKYDESRNYFSDKDAIFATEQINKLYPELVFVHLYGNVDVDYCEQNGISIYPKKQGKAQVMTQTLGYVGLEPILKLQTAGLKVAQEMLNNTLSQISQPVSGF